MILNLAKILVLFIKVCTGSHEKKVTGSHEKKVATY